MSVNRFSKPAIILLSLALLYLLGFLNIQHPVLRLKSAIGNNVSMLLILILPLALIVTCLFLTRRWLKIVLVTVLVPIALISILLAIPPFLNFLIILSEGRATWFEPVHRVQMKGYDIVVYNFDMGATGPYWLEVRQEKTIIQGILLVKRVYSIDRASDANVLVLGENEIEVQAPPYSLKERSNREDVVITLKRWVYF